MIIANKIKALGKLKKEKIYYIAFDTNRMSIEEATYIIDNKSNNHYNCRDEKNNTHHVFNEKILVFIL